MIFGDLVNSIDSLRYLNERINRQLFDLFLLNSQNKATRVSFENASKKNNNDYSIERLKQYKTFLGETSKQLSSTLKKYEKNIEKVLESGKFDYISAFKQAAMRYIDIRNIENVNFTELMKNEQDQVMGHSVWGQSQFSVSNLDNDEFSRQASRKRKLSVKSQKYEKNNLKKVDEMPLPTEERGLIGEEEEEEMMSSPVIKAKKNKSGKGFNFSDLMKKKKSVE